jgi:hypothetical protein
LAAPRGATWHQACTEEVASVSSKTTPPTMAGFFFCAADQLINDA